MAEKRQFKFVCDVMLGRLARWLRAAGYDVVWKEGIDDWELIRLAQREKRILVSCDTGIFRIGIVRDGDVPAYQLPNGLSTKEQLERVLGHFDLPIQKARCMACGGELQQVPKSEMKGRVPPKSYDWAKEFWQCRRCRQPFWRGTHWQKISKLLEQIRK